MKTVRFKELVKKCGAPLLHLSWVPPERDAGLQRAIKEHRVLTVHQELRGSKKDYATVGLLKDANSQVLLFPKSLRAYTDRRVVAIDYDLLAPDPGPRARPQPAKARATKAVVAPAAKPADPAPPPTPAPSVAKPIAPPIPAAAPKPTSKPTRKAAKPRPGRSAAPAAAVPDTAARHASPSRPRAEVPAKRLAEPAAGPSAAVLITGIKKALGELKAGKNVAAYSRLQSLVEGK